MRKALVLLFFLAALDVHSFDLKNSLSLGTLGAGIDTENDRGYWFGSVLNFTGQTRSGLGVMLSPLNVFFSFKDNGNFFLTFLNVSAFYNFFRDEHIILGPLVSISALNYNRADYFELRSGLVFKLRNIGFVKERENSGIFGFDLLTAEFGYKCNNGASAAYAYLGIDLLGALILIGSFQDVEKYNKEHPGY